MILDLSTGELIDGTRTVHLTRRQCRIIRTLAANEMKTVRNSDIIEQVWSIGELESPETAMQMQICRIRSALRRAGIAPLITTVWGSGYRTLVDVEITGAGPASISIPGEYRSELENLLYSHPNKKSADRILSSMGRG